MKRWTILGLAALAVGAQAQQGAPPDVPRNHWAYPAVDELFRAGLLHGYPDGAFRGNRPASRYELAALLAAVNQDLNGRIDKIRSGLAQNGASAQERAALEAQLQDLRKQIDELKAMQADITSLTARMATMREQMSSMRKDVGDMRQRLKG